MNTMNIKIENGTINAYATKAFIKRAQTFGTPEFYEWRAACKEFGKVVNLVVISRNAAANANKNLTYENMTTYMGTLENAGAYLKEFETMKLRSKVQPNPSKFVLDWFKATFPHYKESNIFNDDNNVIELSNEKKSA